MAFSNDVFRDEEFERVAQEVVEPDLNGWDFFVESQGFRIYRRYEAVSQIALRPELFMCRTLFWGSLCLLGVTVLSMYATANLWVY